MKTQPRHYRLKDAIRNCFPMHVREQLEIRPITVCRNNDAAMTIVRINLDDETLCYDADALLTLFEANAIERDRSRAIIKGCYAGRRCEIQLVTQPAAIHA